MTNTAIPATSTPTADAAVAVRNPVTWFEIHTADPARAKRFYGAVFGWTFDEIGPGYETIDQGDGAPIGGGITNRGDDAPAAAVFMVQVPDVAATLAAVRAHGGSVVQDVQTVPNGLSFGYAANPDGAVFGLWCPPA